MTKAFSRAIHHAWKQGLCWTIESRYTHTHWWAFGTGRRTPSRGAFVAPEILRDAPRPPVGTLAGDRHLRRTASGGQHSALRSIWCLKIAFRRVEKLRDIVVSRH